MKKDIQAIFDMYRDDVISGQCLLAIGFGMLIGMPLAMLWRIICGILFMLFGVFKIFKPRAKHIDQHEYDKCPQCGKEFTFFNHGSVEEGVCYTFCECGYDSRKEN